jgi:hypothetical protein
MTSLIFNAPNFIKLETSVFSNGYSTLEKKKENGHVQDKVLEGDLIEIQFPLKKPLASEAVKHRLPC